MARIAGVNIPREKRVEIGLTYIYGVGRSSALSVCKAVSLDPDTKVAVITNTPLFHVATPVRPPRSLAPSVVGRSERAISGYPHPTRDAGRPVASLRDR